MILKSGDQVAIIGPASQLRGPDVGLLHRAVDLLQSWDLGVQVRVATDHHFYLAGPDVVRAEHLHGALADPDVKAIFCLRGGYGTPRLISHLD